MSGNRREKASWKKLRDSYSPVHSDLAEGPATRSENVDTAWVGVIGIAFIGIFTSWFGTQSFAVKLLNTGGAQLGSWLIGIVYIFFILSNREPRTHSPPPQPRTHAPHPQLDSPGMHAPHRDLISQGCL